MKIYKILEMFTLIKKRKLLITIVFLIILFGLFSAAFFYRQYVYFDKFHDKMDIAGSDYGIIELDNGDHIGYSKTGYLSIDGGNYYLVSYKEKYSKEMIEILAWPRIFNQEYRVTLNTSDNTYVYNLDKNLKITSEITPEERKIFDNNKDYIYEKINTLNDFFDLK